MASRLELQSELEELLGSDNVYFQPPESLQMRYPCIRYSLSSGVINFAGNKPYKFYRQYSLTYIYRNPDSGLTDEIAKHFPMLHFDRHYVSDGLNHDVFTLYY